jgi:hypothetical protein
MRNFGGLLMVATTLTLRVPLVLVMDIAVARSHAISVHKSWIVPILRYYFGGKVKYTKGRIMRIV